MKDKQKFMELAAGLTCQKISQK